MWRKAMLYLGLGPDEEYDDYDPAHDDGYDRGGARDRQPGVVLPGGAPASYPDEPSAIGAVRPINAGNRPDSGVQVQPSGVTATPRPRPQVVRPIPMTSNAKPHVVVPDSFNEAQEVADKFKGGQPVVMNLQGADRDLSRRLIDFASGLCYGLGGQMERVGNQVYLLTPANVEVSADERRRLQERGYSA